MSKLLCEYQYTFYACDGSHVGIHHKAEYWNGLPMFEDSENHDLSTLLS